MGKVIASITTSVDGYVTGPDDGPGQGLGRRRRAPAPLGDGRAVDLRLRARHRAATRGERQGVLRRAHGRHRSRDRRPGHVRGGRAPGAAPTRSPAPLVVLTHRTDDQPDPRAGFLFVDGFDAALAQARELAGGGDVLDRRGRRRDPAGAGRRASSTSWRSRPPRSCSAAASGSSRASTQDLDLEILACGTRRTYARPYAVER